MIYPGPLNRAQRLKTQKNYCSFALLNGMSYMCLGETVIVLFAIKLNAPNSMVAALGAVIYFAFFMLPVGKLVAARVGAARSQAVFWTIRNIVAVGVGCSAITAYFGYHTLALIQIFIGACLFYGMRAAGVVMSQPFIGDMTTAEERPQLVGTSNALFYSGCMGSLLIIWYILSISESIWTITGIIGAGACLGVSSTYFIRRMDESPAMLQAARRAIWPEIREVLSLPVIRKLILAMFTNYLAVIMLGASSMLSIKRGYGVSDTAALYFSLMQFMASGALSFLSGRLTGRFGSRTCIFVSFSVLLMVPLLWLVAPYQLSYVYSSLIFLAFGGAYIVANNSMLTYYLQITPERLWVASSMLTSVVTSVGAGVAGMIISSTIFKIIEKFSGDWVVLNRFKVYFLTAWILLIILSYFVWRLPEPQHKKN